MTLKTAESALHRRLVLTLVKYFNENGFPVAAAACDGYPDPPAEGRHEPDVEGRAADGLIAIGEAKTGEGDIGTEHSREQYVDFSSRSMTSDKRPCPFYILVPKPHEVELRHVLGEEGVASKPNVRILTLG